MDVELQVAIIYAVVNNMLSDIAVADISAFEKQLFVHLVATKQELLATIRRTGELSSASEAELREAINSCKAKFIPTV